MMGQLFMLFYNNLFRHIPILSYVYDTSREEAK